MKKLVFIAAIVFLFGSPPIRAQLSGPTEPLSVNNGEAGGGQLCAVYGGGPVLLAAALSLTVTIGTPVAGGMLYTLEWSAPLDSIGPPADSGRAIGYEIAYAQLEDSLLYFWPSCRKLSNVPTPAAPGVRQLVSVIMPIGSCASFALVSWDRAENRSAISNRPRICAEDTEPPRPVNDLRTF